MNTNDSVTPRNGNKLVVIVVARISGCQNQKEISLDDQIDHGKETVVPFYDGPTDWLVIATRGKGERLDRPELEQIATELRKNEADFLVMEDLGRMVRGAEAVRLCGLAVDHGTRVLSPHDGIDTIDDSWEEDVISACRDHVGHNAHTSKRIKHKKMNRFIKFGGATPCEIFGYVKPPGSKTYDDWQKDSAATPIFQEWFGILKETLNYEAVADWLNIRKVLVGNYSRRNTWNGKMVARITRNPLLKGMPGRGFRHTIKHHETGRRISVPNPNGPKYREYPHLAHIEPVVFDEVNNLMRKANSGFGRKLVNGLDPRFRVPRQRTRFPGQHAVCWYCGYHFVWGGNGMKEHLMCSNSREWHCWNSIGIDGEIASQRIVEAVTAELYRLDRFDEQFSELVEQAGRAGGMDLAERWRKLQGGAQAATRQKENLLAAIAEYGPKSMFHDRLEQIEITERELTRERCELDLLGRRALVLPRSTAELRGQLEQEFERLAIDSFEFGDLLRKLVPDFQVYLVRLIDGGHLLPRAKVKLRLASIVPDAVHASEFDRFLERELIIDLFEPPQRERIRAEAVRLDGNGLDQRQIAAQIAERPTQTAVFNALALDRAMREAGRANPYVLVMEPPADYPKLRRHRHPRYEFKPRGGYVQQRL